MEYFLVIIALVSFLLLYFKIADKYNIVDKPNERSSHTEITLRGGGIIFWFAALFYFIMHVQTSYAFFAGITLVAFISFYDDIRSLSGKIRAFVQAFAITLIFWHLQFFELQPWWTIPIAYVLAVGIINAYNFMDGINGITGIYTLVVLLSFYYLNNYANNALLANFTDNDFLIYPMFACLVFLFFNYRKKAKCFAGDVGSISAAFWIIFLLVMVVLKGNSLVWLLFLAVYGVDSICTIVHRLFLRQNIFKPHRMHFYQILSNEQGIDHRVVSMLYGILQAIISFAVISLNDTMPEVYIWLIVIAPLLLGYSLKFRLLKNETKNNKR